MGLTTGFPYMGPLSIFLYHFTMAAIAFSQKTIIPAFADIFVNMTFFDILMNESVSYFDSYSFIKKYFTDLYVFPSK